MIDTLRRPSGDWQKGTRGRGLTGHPAQRDVLAAHAPRRYCLIETMPRDGLMAEW
jgi:hypothetical protein